MDIVFVTESGLDQVWQEKLTELENNKVIVFGFNGFSLVSYEKELSGETEYFHDLAKMSKQLSNVIICGCDTDNYGVYRHSVVIADSGKILGVSDMVHSVDESEFACGGSFRVYDTTAGKIGILVAEDLLFPESVRVLALCDADIIICIYKKISDSMPLTLLKASAYANGVAIGLCAEKYYAVADVKGKISASGRQNIVKTKIKIEKDYHLISSRRRGMYKDFNSGY